MKVREKVYSETLIFKITPTLANELRKRATDEERPVSRVVRRALERYLQQENKSVVSQPGSLDNAFAGAN